MPIFEYHCRRCERPFEAIVFSSREKVACPNCKSTAVKKQLSVFRAGASGKEAGSPAVGGGCACTPQTCGCH